jgi:GNAT superfamily N-acetyltransferase
VIRRYEQQDLEDLYEICVRTANAGGDARGMYDSDKLVGDIFAAPYAILEPDLAFVLDDGGPVGYVLGTADTAAFARKYRERWIPTTRGRYEEPRSAPTTPTERMLAAHFNPERMLVEEAITGYPAHLHIDLLPPYQRQGYGRQLIVTWLGAARAAGAPAVHVSMITANVRVRPFYDRLKFHPIPVGDPNLIYLGRSTDPSDLV